MRHVKQKNRRSGCGVACIGMCANNGYETIRKKLFGEQTTNLYIWTWNDMKRHLRKVRIPYNQAVQCANEWKDISGPAIVWCISKAEERKIPDPKKQVGHYVVFLSSKKIHDPLKDSAVESSSMRRKPREYLQINMT